MQLLPAFSYSKVIRSKANGPSGFTLISLVAMFITAAVTFVTAGMLNNLLGTDIDGTLMSGIILAFCTLVLIIGKFNLLDNLLKVVGAVLFSAP